MAVVSLVVAVEEAVEVAGSCRLLNNTSTQLDQYTSKDNDPTIVVRDVHSSFLFL